MTGGRFEFAPLREGDPPMLLEPLGYVQSIRLAMVGALLVAAFPCGLAAQESGEGRGADTAETGVAALIQVLEVDSRLRVAWRPELRAEGELQPPGRSDVLRLREQAGTIEIPYARIDSIWIGRPATAAGAFIGGLSGAAAGALVLLGVNEVTCDSPTGDCTGPTAAGWALLLGGGTLLGAGVGAVIGSGQVRWAVAFPPRDP